ncbi:MAG: glycosyl transferase [Candidatus Hydrogenedentota bacterium]
MDARTPPRSKLRILHLAESPYFGGITSHILTVAKAFEGHPRYEIVVGTLPGRGGAMALLDQGAEQGIPVRVVPMKATFDMRVFFGLRQLVADQGINLVHTHNYRSTMIAQLAMLAVPTVNTCHGKAIQATWRVRMWQWMELQVMRGRGHVIACSRDVEQWLVSKGVPPRNTRLVYNACAGPSEIPSPQVRSEGVTFLFVGRVVPGKGVDQLVRAIAEVPGARGVVLGDGPLLGSCENLARELGSRVRFEGFHKDPGPFYEAADVVVLPSDMEAFPMVLLEAAAWGRPVIATRVGGIPEIVEDEGNGLLVNPGDATALRAAMARMMNGEDRVRMGLRAREAWEQRFSPTSLVSALERVYDEVLGI